MLDRQKLVSELSKIEQLFIAQTDGSLQQLQQLWDKVSLDEQIDVRLRSKKWSLLVPDWHGALGKTVSVPLQAHPYSVLAVDGSQIYHDKHQGPACYLINVGSVLLQYGQTQSSVLLQTNPEIIVVSEQGGTDLSPEHVNLHREKKELQLAVQQSMDYVGTHEIDDFVCLFDGTLIFFQIDLSAQDASSTFFAEFMNYFEQMYQHRIVHAGYISFPKTKELLNTLRIIAADFVEANLDQTAHWQKMNDMDVAQLFLTPGSRSIIFQSKAPIAYVYPTHLKPYFCYLHVGSEIVRLEFPCWIAQDQQLVDRLCAVALDQASKGRGYPVVLFEAHEQAVIKTAERVFFYEILKKLYVKNDQIYLHSVKSAKKAQVHF